MLVFFCFTDTWNCCIVFDKKKISFTFSKDAMNKIMSQSEEFLILFFFLIVGSVNCSRVGQVTANKQFWALSIKSKEAKCKRGTLI